MAKWAACLSQVSRCSSNRNTGTSPAVYVTSRRVEFAKRMLQDDPRASVTEIAIESGFSSSQHFATVFKRYTGVNPKDFRTASSRRDASPSYTAFAVGKIFQR